MTSGVSVSDAIRGRSSVRAFRPDPVPEDVIREIFDIARLAPSNSNTQPWHVAVVSGAARDALEALIFEEIAAGTAPNPTWPSGGVGLTGDYKQRQIDCAKGYYAEMDIEYEDRAARRELLLNNWRFFGAPHAAFFSMPETMHRANAVDVGIFLQSVMLLMAERGIGSCPQGALASYPGPVREIADIPDGNALLCGLSFGYEAEGEPANRLRTPREPLDRIASFASDPPRSGGPAEPTDQGSS